MIIGIKVSVHGWLSEYFQQFMCASTLHALKQASDSKNKEYTHVYGELDKQ